MPSFTRPRTRALTREVWLLPKPEARRGRAVFKAVGFADLGAQAGDDSGKDSGHLHLHDSDLGADLGLGAALEEPQVENQAVASRQRPRDAGKEQPPRQRHGHPLGRWAAAPRDVPD